jgi:hypothetical protein
MQQHPKKKSSVCRTRVLPLRGGVIAGAGGENVAEDAQEAFQCMVVWLREGGGKVDSLALRLSADGSRGRELVATQHIQEGDTPGTQCLAALCPDTILSLSNLS